MKIYFVTGNKHKISETEEYFKQDEIKNGYNVQLCVVKEQLQEILHKDISVIVRAKALEAYRLVRVPCVVEHGGIFIDALNGLPGGIGQIIWDSVDDRMCGFLNDQDDRTAKARSMIGYCDGKRIYTYLGETSGKITKASRGEYKFNWDPIFEPDNCLETYGEMGPEKKRKTSQAMKAWDKFLEEGMRNYKL